MARYHDYGNGVKVWFTAEEEAARDAEEKAVADGQFDRDLEELRIKRNRLLTQTDWWGTSDNTMTADQTKYRQDLRDLTNGLDTVEKVNNVVFPTKPKE